MAINAILAQWQSNRFVSGRLWVQVPQMASFMPASLPFDAGISFVICPRELIMRDRQRPVTIAVVGGTGAGKTTISNAILDRVGSHHIAYIPHDAYYKDIGDIPFIRPEVRNFDHPDALDTPLM